MLDMIESFPPSRAIALERLAAFAPKAGAAYAKTRNFDNGAGRHSNVSVLSPYLRAKLLDEADVTRATLKHHSAQAAEKFLAEVFWRTYWKGWMELRPSVWLQYQSDINRLRNDVETQAGLRQRWEEACLGQTGIAPFDSWARELVETGYLHNHARMWFASIWIFTLELPWQLGADFFLRHLLDGDAAVNTLSWRWVAGIQTRGKTYLADPGNIAKYTGGRFPDVPGLSRTAVPVDAPENPPAAMLAPCPPPVLSGRYGLLLHCDDVDGTRLAALGPDPAALAYLEVSDGHTPWKMAPEVGLFRSAAAQSTLPERRLNILASAQELAAWAKSKDLDMILAPYAPVGPIRQVFDAYQNLEATAPLRLSRRSLDTAAWPEATKGFFPFRKHIPRFIDLIRRG
ncbi:MAG: FAD-binding domain-containing protein [Pseudomonadota bacterium]